jgi:hypothetical protein
MSNSNPQYGIMCPKCRSIIFSESTHHNPRCQCGSCDVDGGTDYLRYGWSSDLQKDDIQLVARGVENITKGNGA